VTWLSRPVAEDFSQARGKFEQLNEDRRCFRWLLKGNGARPNPGHFGR